MEVKIKNVEFFMGIFSLKISDFYTYLIIIIRHLEPSSTTNVKFYKHNIYINNTITKLDFYSFKQHTQKNFLK